MLVVLLEFSPQITIVTPNSAPSIDSFERKFAPCIFVEETSLISKQKILKPIFIEFLWYFISNVLKISESIKPFKV